MASDNCGNTYQLTRGPKGIQGGVGATGAQGDPGPRGPIGDDGLPGPSKIEVATPVQGFPYRTIIGATNWVDLERMVGSFGGVGKTITNFIYPGESKFGGLLSEVKILFSTTAIGTTFLNNSKTITFNVFKYDNHDAIKIGDIRVQGGDDSEFFTNDVDAPVILSMDLSGNLEEDEFIGFITIDPPRGCHVHVYNVEIR